MRKAVNAIAFLAIAVFITACKIAVVVVEGGEVHSAVSGTCVEGSICVLDVNSSNFSDMFTAVAYDNWYFEKWNSGHRLLCGGSNDRDCRLSFEGYQDSEFVERMVASSETFYLMPVFKPVGDLVSPVSVGNKVWLQPADFVDYSPRQVESICPQPSGLCTGKLPGSDLDLTGYYWASMSEIARLLNTLVIVNPPVTEAELYDPPGFNSGVDPEDIVSIKQEILFSNFRPTHVSENRSIPIFLVFSRDQIVDAQQYQGIVIQYHGLYTGGDIGVDDESGYNASISGAWFWRTLN